jgi:flagellar basal-body rod modification protein FlgD
MSSQERAEASRWVEAENRRLGQEIEQRSVEPNQGMGKDDFLRILITQLTHQDPTSPMQDRDFIAQMAQFSSLEQMTNMASDFARMAQMLKAGEASSFLGKSVEITMEDEIVHGVVQAVTREEMPQVLVNGRFFAWEQVSKVFNENE